MRATTLAGVAVGTAGAIALRRSRNWGAEPWEIAAPLPGDDLVPGPADTTTRGVDIDAPAAEVWRWLVQMGRGRGGMYSYDRLENLLGLDIHSADWIHEKWQRLAVGDRIVVVPTGWGPLPDGYSMVVSRLDAGRALVLRQSPPEHPWNATWSFVVEPVGSASCRLLSRSRAERPTSRGLRFATAVLDPVTTIMTRRMLLGIKQRAEAAVWSDPGVARRVADIATALDSPAGAR
jgi:hypothetical protein